MDATDVRRMEAALERRAGGPLRPYKPQRAGFVYFIQDKRGGPIKIGWAREPERRLADLQVAHPHPLEILGRVRGGPMFEKELHTRFAASRCPNGEWFEPTDELLVLIAELSLRR